MNVKSNDQLFRGQDFKEVILTKLMGCFEKLYVYIESLSNKIIDDREEETAHVLLRVIATMANNFKMKGVINKVIKLSLTTIAANIKEVAKKKKRKRLIASLKATIEDCYLNDNSKIAKVTTKVMEGFQKKKRKSS